jgi:hypothetical protein
MKQVDLELDWKNIDHEKYRTYVFPNDITVNIICPVLLNVSNSGGHRILDRYDVAHYIPSGWVHLFWETNDENAFRF